MVIVIVIVIVLIVMILMIVTIVMMLSEPSVKKQCAAVRAHLSAT